MAERPVVNASPLIFLGRAGLLDFLRLIGPEVVVTETVAQEIHRRGASDPTVQVMAGSSWLIAVPSPPVPPNVLAWGLDAGESTVLAYALAHPGAEAIIDDQAGRRCAKSLDIPIRGTLSLVLLAKQRGKIPAARPVLQQMRVAGMFLADCVMDAALALIGE